MNYLEAVEVMKQDGVKQTQDGETQDGETQDEHQDMKMSSFFNTQSEH